MKMDDDSEWEDEEDIYDESTEDDEDPTIACPYCKRKIHEDSERCLNCEHYISSEDVPPQRKSWLIVIGTVLCLYVVYRWIAG